MKLKSFCTTKETINKTDKLLSLEIEFNVNDVLHRVI